MKFSPTLGTVTDMRARNIKPGYFKSEILAQCSYAARIFFQGLWLCADREGRLEDRPQRLKAEILPYDDEDPEALLDELASKRDSDGKPSFIIRYSGPDGRRYIQILHFIDHQNPHCKEAPSHIPPPDECPTAPDEHHTSTVQASDEHSTSTEVARLIPDSLIPDSLFLQNRGPHASSETEIGLQKETWKEAKTLGNDLYRDGIFKEAPKWVNTMKKRKLHPGAIIIALMRCSLHRPKDPWPYCLEIAEIESQNLYERSAMHEHEKRKKL